MYFTRTFVVIAVSALFVGATTAVTTEDAEAVISKLPFSQKVNKDIAAGMREKDAPVHGRMLAESDFCTTLADSGYCEEYKTEATCPSPKCAFDKDTSECGTANTAALQAMGVKMMASMLLIVADQGKCAESTTAADCSGKCQWSADANKCGVTKATVGTSMTSIGDPTLDALMGPSYECSLVHQSEAECNADTNCEYKKSNSTTSSRKLLGNMGDDSGGGCELKEVVGMTALARYCPDAFKKAQTEAMNDPKTPPEEKAALQKAAEEAAKMPATSSAVVSWASLAVAVVACLLM